MFHAALFWSQIGSGRLLDPSVAVRWGMGALLLAALVALGRAGVPVLWGRRALVVWVLVALLHVTAAPATDLGGITRTAAQTTQVLVDLPSGAASFLFAVSLFAVAASGCPRGSPQYAPDARALVQGRRLAPADPRSSPRLARPSRGIRLIARGRPSVAGRVLHLCPWRAAGRACAMRRVPCGNHASRCHGRGGPGRGETTRVMGRSARLGMTLFLLGVNHRTAALEDREALALSPAEVLDLLERLARARRAA